MDAELLQLAQAGVLALQVAALPNWEEIAAVVVSGVVGLLQCGVIAWGLRQMGKASEERTVQLDIMREESRGQLDIMREESREQTKVLADIGQGIRDQGMVLADIGQGIRDQAQAQTQVLADIGQGIRDQGMVLAKLLQPTP